MSSLTEWLVQHDACSRGLDFARGKTPREAWETCQRPDWMLWALDALGYDDPRALRLFACRCVWQVWHLLPDGPLRAVVEVSERYAVGEATAEELAAALAAARDAAKDAAGVIAWDAAWAAVCAAARDLALDAAKDAARDAAWVIARGAARDAARTVQAYILRELVPVDVVAELFEREMIRGD